MTTHKRSWALMSIKEYGAKALWVLDASWHHAHECLLALISAVGAMFMFFMAAYECLWVLMAAIDHSWALMSTNK